MTKTDKEKPLFSGKFLMDLALQAARSFMMDHLEKCSKCSVGMVEMMSKNHGFAAAPNVCKGFTEYRPKAKIIKAGDRGNCTPKKSATDNDGRPMKGKYRFHVENLKHGDRQLWVYVRKNKQTVMDCNPQYFEAHFTFAVTSKDVK